MSEFGSLLVLRAMEGNKTEERVRECGKGINLQ